jgi:hypothetical protein
LAMASILQKPDKRGQIYELKVSTPRGALQSRISIASELTVRVHALQPGQQRVP